MKIKYLGHACFQLISSNGTTIITDPYTQVGYELPDGLKADAITVSHAHFDHNYTKNINCPNVISTLGESLVKGIRVFGIESYHDEQQGKMRGNNIIYKYEIDNLTVCHLGDLGEPVSLSLLNKIGEVDVLLLPVGGKYTIDEKQAHDYVVALAPKVVIPMHFKPIDGILDIREIGPFLAQFPQDCIIKQDGNELKVSIKDFTNTTIIYLER